MDDSHIIELYWKRDQRAISETAEKYGAYCRSIANNILDDQEDARECENDTYIAAWDAIPPKRPERLSTFLGRITRNLALNRYHRDRAEKRGGGQTALVLEELSCIVSGTDRTYEEMNLHELLEAIGEFLRGQSRERRQIFVLRYWYFESVTSISRKVGISENNVSVTLNRIRSKLRDFLEERGFEI